MPERKVLVVEDDPVIGDLVAAVLADAGYGVSLLGIIDPDALRVAVNRLEPDCVLLDGESPEGYGGSWADAAWLHHRGRSVPVVMFTARGDAADEAAQGESARSREAGFSGVLAKPFDLDALLAAVARAVGEAMPFDESAAGEAVRTAALVAKLGAAGVTGVHASTRREWATGRTAAGAFVMLYWAERDGVYYVVREETAGGGFRQVGRFHDLDAAVALATTVRREPAP